MKLLPALVIANSLNWSFGRLVSRQIRTLTHDNDNKYNVDLKWYVHMSHVSPSLLSCLLSSVSLDTMLHMIWCICRTVLNVVVRLRHARFKSINRPPTPPSMHHHPHLMIMEVTLASYPLFSKDKTHMLTSMKEAGSSSLLPKMKSVQMALSIVRMGTKLALTRHVK